MGNILVIIIFISIILILLKYGYRKKVDKMLFYLVIKAEKEFGGNTGKLKYSAVTTWVYEKLPNILKIIFTDKEIDTLIEESVNQMKEYLGEN